MNDPVSSPSHYTKAKGFEVIDVIEGYDLPYHLGNVIKYVLRHEYKGNALQDLQKAQWYLNRYIEILRETDEAEYQLMLQREADDEGEFVPARDVYGRVLNAAEPIYIVPGFGDRVGGTTEAAKAIQHTYYNHDDQEVIDICDWCGTDILKGETYFAGEDVYGEWIVCSEACRREAKGFRSVGGTD